MKKFFAASTLAFAVSAQADSSLSLSGGSYFTHWNGYNNAWGAVSLRVKSSKPTRFTYSAELLYRSDSTMPVLGNINEMLLSQSDTFAWGRLSARQETSLVSLDRSLNHRVCQTPFECSLGGTIGAHYLSPKFRLSFELLSVPNISPTPGLGADGRLNSQYRWTEIPYQFVEIGGSRLPLRVTSAVNLSAATLLTPGLVAEAPVQWNSSLSTNFVVATQRSKSPYSKRSDGLLVINDPKEGLLAVANSEQNVSFPWQNVALASTRLSLGAKSFAALDLGARFSQEDSLESVLRVGHEMRQLEIQASGGFHQQGTYVFSSLGARLEFRVRSSSVALDTLLLSSAAGSSLLMRPELRVAASRDVSLFAKALLIRSGINENLFAKFRANDSMILGAEYVF